MLTMFFHDRQIEQNLVECVQTIHIDDDHHTPSAHTFPNVNDQARLLCTQSCFGFAGPDREEIPLRHGCWILDAKISVIQHLVVLLQPSSLHGYLLVPDRRLRQSHHIECVQGTVRWYNPISRPCAVHFPCHTNENRCPDHWVQSKYRT